MNLDHEIKTLALVMDIARLESAVDYRLARVAMISLTLVSALLLCGGQSTATVIAATLTTWEFAACARRMLMLHRLKRAYASHISRV